MSSITATFRGVITALGFLACAAATPVNASVIIKALTILALTMSITPCRPTILSELLFV
jgi:hypothetical protein